MEKDPDAVLFDEVVLVALARSVTAPAPRSEVRSRLLARIAEPTAPDGFVFHHARDSRWMAHPVPGIRMRVLSLNQTSGYATLLLDVAPGTRFPPHRHEGAEECYVVSGSLYTCGRRLDAGDFVHADADTDHGELYTEEGCQVILVTPPEDFILAPIPLGG